MISEGDLLQGRYQVVSKVGDGGMQSVYRANDNLIGRTVALKTPLPGQGLKKFADSAVIAGKVNHQAIAKTYDYFEEGGTAFLIEEFIDGDNLDNLVPVGAFLDPHTAAHLMLSLSKGIAASHAAGVVHRDLKPSNVVAEKGSFLAITKITDFGIATMTDAFFEEESKSGELTKSTAGTIKGAIPYMSPEMLFRQPGDHPDKPSDIWSLAAMMYRLLAGDYPFGVGMMVPVNVKTGSRTPWPKFMTAKAQFRPLVAELCGIVEACLVEEPANRPTAEDVVSQCQRLCFSTATREHGRVSTFGNTFGRIARPSGSLVHFHLHSVYGESVVKVNDLVMFSCFPGSPHPRAHPVAILPTNA